VPGTTVLFSTVGDFFPWWVFNNLISQSFPNLLIIPQTKNPTNVGLDCLNNNDYLIIISNHIDNLGLNKPFGDLGPLEWRDPLTLS
jgi:hypothetical protein